MDRFLLWGLTGIFTSLTVAISVYYFRKPNAKALYVQQTEVSTAKHTALPQAPPKSPRNTRSFEEIKMDFSINGIIGDIQKTRSKHLNSLPISVDIPRLAKNFKVYDKNNVELFDGAKYEEINNDQQTVRINIIHELLQTLLMMFVKEDTKQQRIEQSEEEYLQYLNSIQEQFKVNFDEIVKLDGDTSLYMRELFNQHLPDEHKVTSLLKVCNQSVLAAIVVRMKRSLGESYPYKDKRGRWFILVQLPFDSNNISNHHHHNENNENDINANNVIINNQNKDEKKQIVITHRKEELSWDDGTIDHFVPFTFTWELRMYFDEEMKEMQDSQMAIVDFQLLEETSEENIRKLYNCILSCSYLRLECNYFDQFLK